MAITIRLTFFVSANVKSREATEKPFEDHNVLFRKLVDQACAEKIHGAVTFDSYFTHADNLNHLHAHRDAHDQPRTDVGDLKFNRKLLVQGREIKASEWAETISQEQKKEIERENGTKQLYFTTCIRIPKVNHKVRIVVLWKHASTRSWRLYIFVLASSLMREPI